MKPTANEIGPWDFPPGTPAWTAAMLQLEERRKSPEVHMHITNDGEECKCERVQTGHSTRPERHHCPDHSGRRRSSVCEREGSAGATSCYLHTRVRIRAPNAINVQSSTANGIKHLDENRDVLR